MSQGDFAKVALPSYIYPMTMTNYLVYNIEPASTSMIRSLDRHCRERTPDGTSAIDLERSHLNRTLAGSEEGLFASLDAFYENGPKPPAKQAEKPYLRIVVSASPEYFRPDDPEAAGTWDEDRLSAWIDATMSQLRAEHGDDIVFAELHLDEDTPHVHVVVAPTYEKKPRRPGRKKRGETDEQFEARKAAAETAKGTRVVGRASHPELSKKGSFQRLRERMAVGVDHLGIEYGEDRHGQAEAKTTGQWVKEQAAEIRKKQAELAAIEEKTFEKLEESEARLAYASEVEEHFETKLAEVERREAEVSRKEAESEQQSERVSKTLEAAESELAAAKEFRSRVETLGRKVYDAVKYVAKTLGVTTSIREIEKAVADMQKIEEPDTRTTARPKPKQDAASFIDSIIERSAPEETRKETDDGPGF